MDSGRATPVSLYGSLIGGFAEYMYGRDSLRGIATAFAASFDHLLACVQAPNRCSHLHQQKSGLVLAFQEKRSRADMQDESGKLTTVDLTTNLFTTWPARWQTCCSSSLKFNQLNPVSKPQDLHRMFLHAGVPSRRLEYRYRVELTE